MAQRDRYGDHWGPSGNCVFDGDGVPSGPNYLLFSGTDRLADAVWDRSKVGWSPRLHAAVLGALQRALDPKLIGLGLEGRALPSTLLDMYRLMEEVEEYG